MIKKNEYLSVLLNNWKKKRQNKNSSILLDSIFVDKFLYMYLFCKRKI